ncbi:MAG TPA: putative glycoside hydrolase [Acidimicrobiia bacterium]|jgi:hypothetical protein|nr:putative glycoside hydrolase [Acidimicrobiia bacterium]
MRRSPLLVIALALVTTACASPAALVAGDPALTPEPPAPILNLTVIAVDDGTAVSGADVTIDRQVLVTDEDGSISLEWTDELVQYAVAAPGFSATAGSIAAYPETTDGTVEVTMDPHILEGAVVGPNGQPLPGTTVAMNGRTTVTDDTGAFRISRATAGELTVTRPAWEPAAGSWDGEALSVEIQMEPRDIRALRVSGDKAADPDVWAGLLELADQSVVNAFVIDTKDEGGWVYHESAVPTVSEIGALNSNFLYDVEQVIADMDAHGLYKITRITTFQDNFLSRARPEIAVRDNTTGGVWRNYKDIGWLDATDRGAWEYPLALAQEACELGFDEIQFDYVRFPSDGDISTIEVDGGYTEEVRVATIQAFLEEAHALLNPMGCAVAADIFAITLTSDWDEGIGQRPEVLSTAIDVLSPMIYTYTYAPGWNGYEDPDEHAVELVTLALDSGIPRDRGFSIYRPWIQTWQLNAAEIMAVQDVVEERELGWMIWSANTQYDTSFLRPE